MKSEYVRNAMERVSDMDNHCQGCPLAGNIKSCQSIKCHVHDIWYASRLMSEVAKREEMIDRLVEENHLLRSRV